jgi:VanZ family protein
MLGAMIVWALVRGDSRRITFRTVVIATVCGVLYGWSDEFHQIFVPERNYDLHDLLADGMGTFVVPTVLWAWGIIARGGMQAHDV